MRVVTVLCDSCGRDYPPRELTYMFPNGDQARICDHCRDAFTVEELWNRM